MATATQTRPNRYATRCADCGGTVDVGAGDLARESERWVTRHVGECPEIVQAVAVIQANTEPMPEAGYYAVEWNGDLKFYVVRDGEGQWTGRRFLNRYRSDYLDRPATRERTEAVALILADPLAAAMRFAAEQVRCYRCGRNLTDAESRARGLGPHCAGLV